jgi:hypothetical protein
MNLVYIVFFIKGTTYISTLIFAAISDAKLGRAKTILIGELHERLFKSVVIHTAIFSLGFLLYLIGYALVTTTAQGNTPMCYFNGTEHSSTVSIFHEKCDLSILGSLICT